MNRRITLLATLAVALCVAATAWADDGWSLSKLNPFKKKTSAAERAHASFSDQAPDRGGTPGVNLPQWGPRSHSPTIRKEPSTLTKLNRGTLDLLDKTKDILTPWSDDSKRKSTRSGQKPKKEFFFTSWFKRKEEPQRPKSVADFIAQPRPGF